MTVHSGSMFASPARKGQPKLRLPSTLVAFGIAVLLLLPAVGPGLPRAQALDHARLQGATISLQAAPAIAQIVLEDALELEEGESLFILSIDLQDGWKTYWRLPGRFGLAPAFDWQGSENLADARTIFPQPSLFEEADGLSLGYTAPTLWPIVVRSRNADRPVRVRLSLEVGLCREICLPERVDLVAQAPQLDGPQGLSMASIMALPPQLAAQAGSLDSIRLGWRSNELRLELDRSVDLTAFAVAEDASGRHVVLRPYSSSDSSLLLGQWPWSTVIDRITLVEPGWRMRIFSDDL